MAPLHPMIPELGLFHDLRQTFRGLQGRRNALRNGAQPKWSLKDVPICLGAKPLQKN
jgi:hypothetical protein